MRSRRRFTESEREEVLAHLAKRYGELDEVVADLVDTASAAYEKLRADMDDLQGQLAALTLVEYSLALYISKASPHLKDTVRKSFQMWRDRRSGEANANYLQGFSDAEAFWRKAFEDD